MKAFYVFLALVFLASCGEEVVVNEVAVDDQAIEQTVSEIEAQLETIEVTSDDEEAAVESEIVVLDGTYTNPKTEVDMEIEYSLDADGNIESIDVSATTYDLSDFNFEIQDVVGMTIEEASSIYISGESLTSAAFNEALKNG